VLVTEETEITTSGPAPDAETAHGSSLLATSRSLVLTIGSAALPGFGHLMLGQIPSGMVLFASFGALLCGFWPLRLLRYYPGFFVLYCGWLALSLYSSWSTQVMPHPRAGLRVSKWWFVLTIPSALVVVSVLGAGVTRASGFRDFQVPSTSMEPTIQHGDRIVVDDRAFRAAVPQYRDVVVWYRDQTYFIKRVIGMGGDTVEGRDGSILVNGNALNESYIQHSRAGSVTDWQEQGNSWMQNFGPVTVPSGKYFVLGDNRDESLDSRSPEFGLVDRASVIGRVLYVYSAARQGGRVR
jgi:signal peptidase I